MTIDTVCPNQSCKAVDSFAHKAVEEINKNLTEQLKGTGLPPDLKIQSLHPDKNYPLLSIAVQSWQSLN